MEIRKQIQLDAPLSRVWRALTDHKEFGAWFGVRLDAPFVPGEPATGHMTYPGYEHIQWTSITQKIEPETYFSYTWHPYAIDPEKDYSGETPTLVEFKLEPRDGGTLLTVTESGFENVPEYRRDEAFRMDEGGWAAQMENIQQYVISHPA